MVPTVTRGQNPKPRAAGERAATVTNAKNEFVSNLDAKDFQVTDNGVPQKIADLDFGHTSLSMVLLVETSSRIKPLLSDMRKTGVLFADALMGPNDEAAALGSVTRWTVWQTSRPITR